MRAIFIGIIFSLFGTVVNSLAMNLWKASAELEADLPPCSRRRFMIGIFLGVFCNVPLDGLALMLTPLSLIAVLQGLTIALTVFFAVLGCGGHQEDVSTLQWKAIGVTSIGLVVCAAYGPAVEAERAWWPLIKHYFDPMWQCYMWSSYGIATFVFATQRMPSLRFLAPPKGSIAWTVLACGVSGMLAGLLQTQLKVLAQCIRSVGDPAQIGCRHAPPG